MKIIQHRVNSVELLSKVPKELGVEIDLRSGPEGLHLSHDPFDRGESLSNFLDKFEHDLLIVNVKEDGLEEECSRLLDSRGVSQYLFLDQAMPTIIRRGLQGFRDSFCRVSEFELIEGARALTPFCHWVWLDSFLGVDFVRNALDDLKRMGLNVCLVSPELHGLDREGVARDLLGELATISLTPDAVCTKFPNLWRGLGS